MKRAAAIAVLVVAAFGAGQVTASDIELARAGSIDGCLRVRFLSERGYDRARIRSLIPASSAACLRLGRYLPRP